MVMKGEYICERKDIITLKVTANNFRGLNMDKKTKIAVIGAGPAGLFACLLLSQFDVLVDVYEKGNNMIDRQLCPYETTGKCANCPICNISSGLGGGGGRSDGKFLPSEGGNLIEILGRKKYNEYLKWASNMCLQYADMAGIAPIRYGREETEYIKECKRRAKRAGVRLEIHPIDHYGTDGAMRLFYQIENDLRHKSNVKLFFKTKVTKVLFDKRIVYSKRGAVEYDDIIIAPGRAGSNWMAQLCMDNNIPAKFGKLIVGVRAEVPDYINDMRIGPLVEIEDDCLEGKVRYIFSKGNFVKSAKTFCECLGGVITAEYYPGKGVAVNGHSNSMSKTRYSNVSILLDIDPDQVENPKEFIWDLLKSANSVGGGQPITQTYKAFKEHRSNTQEELKAIESTKKQLFSGDLTKVFTPPMVSALVFFIEKINKVYPGFTDQLVLHGVEVKPVSFTPEMDSCFRVAPHIYVAGDGVNNTHGALPAEGNGLAVAAELLSKYSHLKETYNVLKKDHPFLP